MSPRASRGGRLRVAGVSLLAAVLAASATAVYLGVRSHHPARTSPTKTKVSAPARRTSTVTTVRRPGPPKGPHNSPVPILMYHVIAAPPSSATYPGLYVSPAELSAQVEGLADHGFHAVTLEQVYRYWKGVEALPPNPIVFTFDDGYRSVYSNALPILRARGWPGVVNLEVRNMHVSWGLSPRHLRALIGAGWEIDSHTITHPDLTTLGPSELEHEVQGSRAILEDTLRVPVDFFCYPSGRYDASVIAAVEAAGYLGATTTAPGLARPGDLFTLDRVRVSPGMSAAALAKELRSLGLDV
jgi:peptidoglycan/xylan/chitin deacetylase (PgdA/CDA1 family)